MGYRVDISDLADTDTDEILTWIGKRSRSAADDWLEVLLQQIGSLERILRRCPVAPVTRSFLIEIRHLLFSHRNLQYRIIFGVSIDESPHEGVVTIYRIRNSSQRPLLDSDLFDEIDED